MNRLLNHAPSLAFTVLLIASPLLAAESKPAPLIEDGEIGGALYKIATPHDWHGGIAINCHGYIPAEFPLVAYLPPHKEPFASFLAAGWKVAATSYRRNGLNIREAMDDVIALQDHLNPAKSDFPTTLLLGESMGNAITLLLMETHCERFAGALVLGRGMDAREQGDPLPFTYALADPVLIMTNQSEIQSPTQYRNGFSADAAFRPALWTALSDGHILFTDWEYREAAAALLAKVRGGYWAPEKRFSIPAVEPASVATFSKGKKEAKTRVSDHGPTYGNLEIRLTASDLEAMGISKGDIFRLIPAHQENQFEVTYATTYGDVPRGEWVAFINEFALLQVAINHGNASATAGLTIGDAVTVIASQPSD